ncbi:hypothetical protein CP973_14380 [Streptomyces albofaciens JCM 4342]|nr:hypothetical protein CP973_14380 [Streptomyces albofaciens JCM 4342]
MRLCFTRPGVRRTWTVELRPQPGGPVLVCQQCTHGERRLIGSTARAEVLAHLGWHASRNLLPSHLRTCQCHERGCSWHSRHRGCQGPIRLLLSREGGGRLWRLTDACAACAAATSQAAIVPDTILATADSPRRQANPRRRRHPRGPDSQTRVREMLNYLAATLPTGTGAEARLMALQFALRMNNKAQAKIPRGVLRSLRLGAAPQGWDELLQAGWLLRLPPKGPALEVQLLDTTLLTQHPARPDRLRAADWALRTACRPRDGLAPLPLLATLCLAAHSAPGEDNGTAKAELLARECGTSLRGLTVTLDHLTTKQVLRSWHTGATPEDLCWTLTESVRDQ